MTTHRARTLTAPTVRLDHDAAADWRDQAACAPFVELGDDPWYQPAGNETNARRADRIARAVAICRECPVRERCAEELWDDRYAIVGGLTVEQRPKGRKGRERTRKLRPITHGTEGGYRAHHRRSETPCDECRTANAQARKERES